MNSYVMLYPNSNANPSDKYRVCLYGAWCDYVNGKVLDYPAEDFDNIQDALGYRARMNNQIGVADQLKS